MIAGGVDARVVAGQADVVDEHGLHRCIARALAEAQKRAVYRRAAVHPRGHPVHEPLVEVVVAVPLELFRRNAAVVDQGVEYFRDAARQGRTGEWKAVTHGVAGPDLDRDLRLFGKLHQLLRKGDDEAVEVRPGDVFEMAARLYALFERRSDDVEILLQGVLARHVELQKYMIVRA